MICTSIQNLGLDAIFPLLESGAVEMAEIRLDRCPLTEKEIVELFSRTDIPLIATCRENEAPKAEKRLLAAINAGAWAADLEVDFPEPAARRLVKACRESGVYVIRSWHDYEATPPLLDLRKKASECRSKGADIVKIVTTATSPKDPETIKALYESVAPLVALCMGGYGHESRLECLRWGAPFTYAASAEGEETAPGQWPSVEMAAKIYPAGSLLKNPGAVVIPSSKSFAQRAILSAALCDGTSRLSGYSPCGDSEAAIALAKALGAEIERNDDVLEIKGIAAVPGTGTPEEVFVGESGLLTRLTIPLLSVLSSEKVRVSGEKTLLGRPLADAHDIMAAFGVRLYPENPAPRKNDCLLPLSVQGPVIPGRATVTGRGGSQLISGLLGALPLCNGKTILRVEEPKSIPYMFITIDVLKRFGIKISSEMEGGEAFVGDKDWNDCSALTFRIPGGQRYSPASFRIEGDWSSAAPYLVAGAIFGEATVEGLDSSSLQADISIIDILTDAGASISQFDAESGHESAPIHVCRAPLSAFEADMNHCPDLFPLTAVLASFCAGESRLFGVERLRHKETDRADAIVSMLTAMGVKVRVEEDLMVVEGETLVRRLMTGHLLKGGSFSSRGDHRMVMALKVASLGAASPVEIDDEKCVSKSYPEFISDWDHFIGKS